MVQLELLNLRERVDLELLELLLPLYVEVLEHIVTDLDVLLHLSALNVESKFVLVSDDLPLEEPHLLHEVFVQLILVNFGALFC